jgi:cytochrome c-type biogenesis protein CcmH/NrfG
MKGDHMTSIIIVVVVMACAGWMAWSRWNYWRTPIRPQPSAEISPQTLAFEAFTIGNSCLAAGQLADATAAFERARVLDPKRPYVAERLAEVARQQHALSAPAPVAAGG